MSTELLERAFAMPKGARQLIALAGPPASGKSTRAGGLAEALSRAGRAAAVVPMDGFHLDNRILDARGLRARKGAPETFDLRGFSRLIEALSAGGEVIFPLFDRDLDLAIAGAGVVSASCDLVVIEGNYLLFDAPGWRDLSRHWALSAFLEVPEPVLRDRLTERWITHGLTPQDAHARAEQNDIPNASRVLSARLDADMVLTE